MISTKEAASRLGVSETRVRTLLSNNQLDGEKIGRMWVVSELSVATRLKNGAKAGRPKRDAATSVAHAEEVETESKLSTHELYEECKRNLSGAFRSDEVSQEASTEEMRFCICVANFFLQEKQRSLVEQGVF